MRADVYAAQYDIAAVHRLGAKRQTSVTEAVFTVFDDDVAVGTVAYALFGYLHSVVVLLEGVGIRTLAAFYGYGIIVDRHIAVFHEDVLHHVKVYGVGRRSLAVVGRTE